MNFDQATVDRVLASYVAPTLAVDRALAAAKSMGDRNAEQILSLNWRSPDSRRDICATLGVTEDELRAAGMILCEKVPIWAYGCHVWEFTEEAGKLARRLKGNPAADIPQGYESNW